MKENTFGKSMQQSMKKELNKAQSHVKNIPLNMKPDDVYIQVASEAHFKTVKGLESTYLR